MKYIKLNNGKRAIVDNEDKTRLLELAGKRKWCMGNAGYSHHTTYKKNIRYTTLMHRFIMNAPKGMDVDHINGNRLDNRKVNLRICTRGENLRNSKMHDDNKLGYKGITKYRHFELYSVRPVFNGKRYYLGYFKTPKEAHEAYLKFVKEKHGEFANTKRNVTK